MWDPATRTWSGFGTAIEGVIARDVAVGPDGELYVSFQRYETGACWVARWNGASWDRLGPEFFGEGTKLLVTTNGTIFVAGAFSYNGINAIARLEGTAWQPLGTGLQGGQSRTDVFGMIEMANGDLIVAGNFATAGGIAVGHIARWNGSTWSALGEGLNAPASSLVKAADGSVIVGGGFAMAGTTVVGGLARWNGASWSGFGGGTTAPAWALGVLADGSVIASDRTTQAGTVARVRRWNGAGWSTVGSTFGLGLGSSSTSVSAFVQLSDGSWVVGGNFGSAANRQAFNVAQFAGDDWQPVSEGRFVQLLAVTRSLDGELVAAGRFPNAVGFLEPAVARWTVAGWQVITPPLTFTSAVILNCIAVLTNGDIVVGGNFNAAGGVPTNFIARWNGIVWSALGSGMNDSVSALVATSDGGVVAGGYFTRAGGASISNIARWNGTSWVAMGTGRPYAVTALATLPNGRIVAGGGAGGTSTMSIAQWTGTSWVSMGQAVNGRVTSLAATPGGGVYAGGDFLSIGATQANRIAYWDGTTWRALAAGIASGTYVSLAAGLNEEVFVGGAFNTVSGVAARKIARWDGQQWSSPGNGINGEGASVAIDHSGDVVAYGRFSAAGMYMSDGVARWRRTGVPMITNQPSGMAVCRSASATLGVVATGSGTLTYRWRKNGQWMDAASNPSVATSQLTLAPGSAMTGKYDCLVGNMCGATASEIVSITLLCQSVADVASLGGGAGCDGTITADDLVLYLGEYFAGNLAVADVARLGGAPSPDGQLTADDLIVFLGAFFAGCP